VLVNRLANCPADFLAPPRVGEHGTVAVAAVVGDVVRRAGGELPEEWIARLDTGHADAAAVNWLRGCLVGCWLITDPALAGEVSAEEILHFFDADLARITDLVRADLLVHDSDRREELARSLLRSVDLVPGGESADAAADRLATLDSVNRLRVEGEARAAVQRAEEVREALARKAAEEAAAQASRE
jgi:hypothetical protein